MSDAITELFNSNFINLDEQLLVDGTISVIENDTKRDAETNELNFNENGFLEKLYQFFESFSQSKLAIILKVFNMKVKNLVLDNYIDVVEVNSSMNPIYSFHSHLCSYKGSESVDHLVLTKKLSLCFSRHVITNI